MLSAVNVADEDTDLDDVGGGYAEELDDMVEQITNLVVLGMKNFCSSEAILNRACLVLHNLSQSPDYLPVLLWTPHCYQMLEWCGTNHSTDTVLLRSASSTLGRIQAYLSQHEDEREKFVQSLQREQQERRQQRESRTDEQILASSASL